MAISASPIQPRGLTPFFATLVAFAVLNEHPGAQKMVCIALLTFGILLFAKKLEHRIKGRTLIFASIAALIVAGYSVSNGLGTRLNKDWLSYTAWLFLLDGGAFVAAVGAVQGRSF